MADKKIVTARDLLQVLQELPPEDLDLEIRVLNREFHTHLPLGQVSVAMDGYTDESCKIFETKSKKHLLIS